MPASMLRETAAPTTAEQDGLPDEAVRQPLGEDLDLRLLARRALDGVDDVPESRLASDAVDAHHDLPVLDGRPGVDLVAGLALDGQPLAGHGVLVDQGLPADHVAVDRNPLAGSEHDRVAGRDGRRGDALLVPALQSAHHLVRRRKEVAERSPTAHDGALQDPLAECGETGEQAGRRVVPAHQQQGEGHGVQRVHVQTRTLAKGPARAPEDREPRQQDERGGDAGRHGEERRGEGRAGRQEVQEGSVMSPRGPLGAGWSGSPGKRAPGSCGNRRPPVASRTWGASNGPPKPPRARRAPAKSGCSSMPPALVAPRRRRGVPRYSGDLLARREGRPRCTPSDRTR